MPASTGVDVDEQELSDLKHRKSHGSLTKDDLYGDAEGGIVVMSKGVDDDSDEALDEVVIEKAEQVAIQVRFLCRGMLHFC